MKRTHSQLLYDATLGRLRSALKILTEAEHILRGLAAEEEPTRPKESREINRHSLAAERKAEST